MSYALLGVGAEFDELNESQPACPACGAFPGMGRDDEDVCALWMTRR